MISSDEPELTDAPRFNTTAVLVRICYHFVRNSSTKKGCSCLKHACPRWRQHLAVETVCLKAWSAVPTTQLFFCWKSQTESFKSCSIHDPSTLDENILLQITFFFLGKYLSYFGKLHCLDLPVLTREGSGRGSAHKLSSDVGFDSRTNILRFL